MSSLRRINSSRANGARSRGPITPEGKERASTNALRHGLLAKCLALENESNEGFDDLVTQHIQRFAPADGGEFALTEEMAAANWRMRCAWAIETRLMNKAIRHQPPGDELDRTANAFSQLAASPRLNLLHRYEARLHRIYQRALDKLVMLRNPELPNDPTPISEQCAHDANLTCHSMQAAEPVTVARPETIASGLRAQSPVPNSSGPAQAGGACGVDTRPPAPPRDGLPAAPSEDAAGL